jgi:hypothetical protein
MFRTPYGQQQGWRRLAFSPSIFAPEYPPAPSLRLGQPPPDPFPVGTGLSCPALGAMVKALGPIRQ